MPESPYFLLGKEQRDEARRVLAQLRGHADVDDEFKAMEQSVRDSKENRGTFKELLHPDNRKGIVNLFVIVVVSFFSGDTAIKDYSQTIFAKIESDLEPQDISIILAAVSLVAFFIGNVAVDRMGRKPLLLISVTVCALCNTTVAIYFKLSDRHGHDVSAIGWLPIFALMTFQVSFGVGLGLAFNIMLGEIFPKHLKAILGGSCILVSSVSETIVSKSFQTISENVGGDVSYALFAACLFVSIPFIIWRIPETKGKSFAEILSMMRPKK